MRLILLITFLISVQCNLALADRALLVGADVYPNLDEFSQLPGVRKDIPAMKNLLLDVYGLGEGEILVLSGRDATRERIISEFRSWLVDGVAPGERAFFYFSGHGTQVQDTSGDEEDGIDQAIVPADAKFEAVAAGQEPQLQNLIVDDEIRNLLGLLKGRKTLAIFDSCFSGTVTRNVDLLPGSGENRARSLQAALGLAGSPSIASRSEASELILPMEEWVPEAGVASVEAATIALSASDRNQLAFEGTDGGIFTQSFSRTLRGARQNGETPEFRDVLRKVAEVSSAFCSSSAECQNRNGGRLAPQIADPEHLRFSAISLDRTSQGGAAELLWDMSETVAQVGFDVELSIPTQSDFKLQEGQIVKLAVRSEVGGNLLILDVSPDGNTYVIHPTRDEPKGLQVNANALTVLDRDLHVRTPGKGQLVALVVERGLDLASLLTVRADTTVDASELRRQVLPQLAADWESVVGGEAEREGISWSFSVVDYIVEAW